MEEQRVAMEPRKTRREWAFVLNYQNSNTLHVATSWEETHDTEDDRSGDDEPRHGQNQTYLAPAHPGNNSTSGQSIQFPHKLLSKQHLQLVHDLQPYQPELVSPLPEHLDAETQANDVDR